MNPEPSWEGIDLEGAALLHEGVLQLSHLSETELHRSRSQVTRTSTSTVPRGPGVLAPFFSCKTSQLAAGSGPPATMSGLPGDGDWGVFLAGAAPGTVKCISKLIWACTQKVEMSKSPRSSNSLPGAEKGGRECKASEGPKL